MAKADSKDWDFAVVAELMDFFDDADIFCRVSRSVTEHDSVWSHFDYFVGSGIIWNYGYLAAAFFQFALNVELGTEVEENDGMQGGVAGALPRREGSDQRSGREGRDFSLFYIYYLNCVGDFVVFDFFEEFLRAEVFGAFAAYYHAVHDAGFAKAFCEGAGVDAADADDALGFKEVVERAGAAEVGRLVAELADYIAADEAFPAFVIFGDDSVISYKGEGLGNYLAVVAWVGEGFEVAGHSCGKNCFADCGASCSD